MVLNQSAKLFLGGAAVGIATAWPAGYAIRNFLFGVTLTDTMSWAVALILLGTVALLATLVPARRAARADPAVTLRSESI